MYLTVGVGKLVRQSWLFFFFLRELALPSNLKKKNRE